MQTPKNNNRWISDIRPENITAYTETNETQSAEYKIIDTHPIINGILDKLTFFRTHAAAVWYNKLKNRTIKDEIDEINEKLGGFSFYNSELTQEEYDALSSDLKNTPQKLFVIE